MRARFRKRLFVWGSMLLLLCLVASPVLALTPPPAGTAGDQQANSGDQAAVVEALTSGGSIQQNGTLLADRFGVTLALKPNSGGANNWSFDWDSFRPTKNVNTVDWIETDWYGYWSPTSWSTSDVRGYLPSGGEWYDVEALYFDNDDQYFYIAIVTSVPHLKDWGGGHVGVGIYENRSNLNYWLRPGDLSIDLGLGTARAERFGDWHYNYGLDLVHDDRTAEQAIHDNNLGNLLYKTSSDAGGWDSAGDNPNVAGDWYTSGYSYNTRGGWEHTNFDPFFTDASHSPLSPLGSATVAYYRYDFPGGNLENGAETYVIEATIPRSLFGTDNPSDGDWIGLRWVEGCRNDGNEDQDVVYLRGDVDYPEMGDAPDSSNHFSATMTYEGQNTGAAAYFPTVADPGTTSGGAPYGMCHVILPSSARLGNVVSAERDADQSPDQDSPAYPTNLDPAADRPDRDRGDDGLLLPRQWQDGVQTTIQYTVTVPSDGVSRTRYVNAWFDWNRDGDWGDAGVACRTAGLSADEHVVVNRPVSVTPGTQMSFSESITPCNPGQDGDPLWVRITLSEEPVQSRNVRDEFHNYSYSNNDGTENWLNDWQEESEDGTSGPAGGEVRVEHGRLCIGPRSGTFPAAWRRVDLTGAVSATLSFDYAATANASDDVVAVQVRTGGGVWTTLETFTGTVSGTFNYDLGSYIAADTDIRFRVQNGYDTQSSDRDKDVFCADNVEIAFSTGLEDGRGPGYCYADGETEDWYFAAEAPTSVVIASFDAVAYPDAVRLEWETATELEVLGFYVSRAGSPEGPRLRLNGDLIPSQVPGSPLGASYQYVDGEVEPGQLYYYWLEEVDTRGQTMLHGPVSATGGQAQAADKYRVFLPWITRNP